VKHAGGAISWENASWPNLASAETKVTFENNYTDVCVDRDHTVSGTLQIPPSGGTKQDWKIGFTANRDAGSAGADSTRVELILPGTLDTNDSTEFRSNNPKLIGFWPAPNFSWICF
jgi:hypothetical protein